MDIERYVNRITDSVVTAAALGDEQTQRTAAALAHALAAPTRLVLLQALSDMTDEITPHIAPATVSVRLDGDDAVVDVRTDTRGDTDGDATRPETTFEELTGDISRVTLRMVEELKARAETAAQQRGVSLNSWVSQAVQNAVRDQAGGNGPWGDPWGWRARGGPWAARPGGRPDAGRGAWGGPCGSAPAGGSATDGDDAPADSAPGADGKTTDRSTVDSDRPTDENRD